MLAISCIFRSFRSVSLNWIKTAATGRCRNGRLPSKRLLPAAVKAWKSADAQVRGSEVPDGIRTDNEQSGQKRRHRQKRPQRRSAHGDTHRPQPMKLPPSEECPARRGRLRTLLRLLPAPAQPDRMGGNRAHTAEGSANGWSQRRTGGETRPQACLWAAFFGFSRRQQRTAPNVKAAAAVAQQIPPSAAGEAMPKAV